MINEIIEAISTALNEEFGDCYEIHMEEIRQDLKEPCFFIQCLNPTVQLFRGKKYFRQNPFCIQYFPETRNDYNRECLEVAERMFFCLEYINAKGWMRGTRMRSRITDGVLSYFVNYDCYVYKTENIPVMEDFVSHTLVKEGDEHGKNEREW